MKKTINQKIDFYMERYGYWITSFVVFSIFFSLFFIVIVTATTIKKIFFEDAVYIAVSGPMSGKSQANGIAMVKGIQLYLDQVNKQGGINGNPVKLLIFDDQNRPELAKKNAVKIAKSEAIAVIGHYTSSASLAAAPVYQKYGIPAISASATADEITQDNDWYFRIIFNNSDQGALIANYMRQIIKYESASILFDEDAYGSTLAAAFVKTAKEIGLEIKHQWHFNTKDPNSFKESLELMKTNLNDEADILFLATHSSEAVQAVTVLRNLNHRFPIMGADALSSSNFILKINMLNKQQGSDYSEGIYTTSPFFAELAGHLAQDFIHDFKKKYQDTATTTAAMYYDAARIVLLNLKKIKNQKQQQMLRDAQIEIPLSLIVDLSNISFGEARGLLKESLQQLSNPNAAIEGITGTLYFDKNGDAVRTIPVGVYKKGILSIAFDQYQPVISLHADSVLQQEMSDKLIISINDKLMHKTQVVYVGLDFNKITDIDLKNSSYSADFYLWFRFKETFDEKNIEFVNSFDSNIRFEPILHWNSTVDEGVTTKTYRLKAKFKGDFNFYNYPLDQHTLPVIIRHRFLSREDLIFVVDTLGMNLDKVGHDAFLKKFDDKNVFSQKCWQINKVLFFQNTKRNDSTLGIPELFESQQRLEYSQFNATIEIKRDAWIYLLKKLYPIFIVIFLGYIIFFTEILIVQSVTVLNIIMPTSLLHSKLSSELPSIAYFTLMEYLFYMVYLLALLSMLVAISMHTNAKYPYRVQFLKKMGKIVYPLLVVVGFIVIFSVAVV